MSNRGRGDLGPGELHLDDDDLRLVLSVTVRKSQLLALLYPAPADPGSDDD